MSDLVVDLAVVGGGFGGSLTALLARRIGLSCALIERGTHPRFVIGESSTPVANLVLAGLVRRYDLPTLAPLCKYGPWRRRYPGINCGLKRGFSYFRHQAGRPFEPRADHANEMLVAANPDAEQGDTHWHRADVDHFFFQEATAAGVTVWDQTELDAVESGPTWTLTGHRGDTPVRIQADFLIDATGQGGFLASKLGLDDLTHTLRTDSRTIYAHFNDVKPWHDLYAAANPPSHDHPFDCDAAALHHIFDGGWMWVLRFDNGVTSAGLVLDNGCHPPDAARTPADEWSHIVGQYPSIAQQFALAKPIMPLHRTGRLQRLTGPIAGRDWALLPSAACFVDPLHSTGIAHTLTGIERLIDILAESTDPDRRAQRLAGYDLAVRREAQMIDAIIHGSYRLFDRFDLLTDYVMLYFAAATFSEHRRRTGLATPDEGYLLSHDERFCALVHRTHRQVLRLTESEPISQADADAFRQQLKASLEPYNLVGLCDRSKANMYDYS